MKNYKKIDKEEMHKDSPVPPKQAGKEMRKKAAMRKLKKNK